MIRIEEALLIAEEHHAAESSVSNYVDEEELTGAEQSVLEYLDSNLEIGVHKKFNGEVFDFRIPFEKVASHVVAALRARWEQAGWQVGVFVIYAEPGEGSVQKYYQFILAAPRIRVEDAVLIKKREPTPKTLRPIAQLPALVQTRGPRLLVRMPTRERPEQAIWVLEKYRRMAGAAIQIEVVIDDNDATMHRAEVIQRLAALDCTITSGVHKSKIEACNGGQLREWDILMLVSDDMVPLQEGYAARVISAMQEKWPHLDGALCFNDGHQKPDSDGIPLCTLPIFGRRLYDQFGYVYEPEYKSLYCDREQTDILRSMGRLVYVDEQIIEHRHHIWGRAEKDALYARNDALEDADRKTYEWRKSEYKLGAQWGFASPPLRLSVLICTVPDRRAQLDWLLRHLWTQIIDLAPREVEVLVDDREKITVGEKRQALLERARGKFVAFIDDDDGISSDYVSRVVSAIKEVPDADCVGFEGVITSNGANPQRFTHSIKYDGWFTKDGIHYRWPNHLNALRRELALKVGFVSKNVGEDFEFSKHIRPLLKREASIGNVPIYYYWFEPMRSVQAK